jgi:hypothetical protein
MGQTKQVVTKERRLSHVELIQPREKISPSLGGTGYLPPSRPATLPELAEAIRQGQIVWKVARNSVNWRRPAETRRLQFENLQIKCAVIGSMRDWWFVRVLAD